MILIMKCLDWAFLISVINIGMAVMHACEMGTLLLPHCHSSYNKYGILMIFHAIEWVKVYR